MKTTNTPFFGLMVCSRTSVWGDKPCDEAELVSYLRVDRRTVDDPMKNPHIGKLWYDIGHNHRVENGMIARDFEDTRWVVRIADEAALQAFCEKYGQVVLTINDSGLQPCYEIEIYDTYRE
jgi:hypothetical protein